VKNGELKFSKLTKGEYFCFIGEAGSYTMFIADNFIHDAMHRYPDASIYFKHLKHGETLPDDARFDTVRSMLKLEPDCIVVTSLIRPRLIPLADYTRKHPDVVSIECSATTEAYVVQLSLGDSTSYWKGDAHFQRFAQCEKPAHPEQHLW
jgi:hypothetical protein